MHQVQVQVHLLNLAKTLCT